MFNSLPHENGLLFQRVQCGKGENSIFTTGSLSQLTVVSVISDKPD